MGSELTSVRSILGLKPDSAIDDLPHGGSANQSIAASPRARSSRRMILNQDQRIRLDGVNLPFTQNDLRESAYDAGAIGFIAKFLVQTTLPHRRQSGSHYTRTDGRFTLRITDVGGAGLPYGSYPRLILIWMTSEAIRTASRELELGASLSRFMAELGLHVTGGHWGTIPRFRDQMRRLIGAAISMRWEQEEHGQHRTTGENLLLADRFQLWWTPQILPAAPPATSFITLSTNFFEQLVAAPVPLDLRAVRVLKQSPLALDLYAWATRRVSYLDRPTLIPWEALRRSFGSGYSETPQGRACFRAKALDALGRVCRVYSSLRLEIEDRGVLLLPSAPHIPMLTR
ncbi:MAG: replication protein RepA [Terracidiphilus sp.]|nr:replication protein RepA [Terracidiphilus sp.]